jgi:DNA-binding protein HU-beta
MNKEQLVKKISEEAEVNQKITNEVLSATIDVIMEAVASGDKVTIVGFGTFEPRDRKERAGRNPRTGDPMTIPATVVPCFKAGKLFKNKVGDK